MREWLFVVGFWLGLQARRRWGVDASLFFSCTIGEIKTDFVPVIIRYFQMLSLPPRILVEADYFSLWQYTPDVNKPRAYAVRPISVDQNILPEDICFRADNWGFWFFYELHNQGWPYKAVLVDADGFNKVGREIASSVKAYVGERSIVGYRPILSNGGYGKIGTVFK